MHLMQRFRGRSNIFTLWNTQRTLFGAWQLLGDAVASEHFACAGYDVVCIDLQHGLMSESQAFEGVRALSAFSETCIPMIRVAKNDPSSIHRALDAVYQFIHRSAVIRSGSGFLGSAWNCCTIDKL
jgi:2-keto-3-deoxy-L-rhamnonate aldolase RhmA